jgi:Ca2+-transporting ATPase
VDNTFTGHCSSTLWSSGIIFPQKPAFVFLCTVTFWGLITGGLKILAAIRNEVTCNPFIYGALAFCVALLLAAVHLPGLSDLLATEDLQSTCWLLVLGMSILPLLIGQIPKILGWGEI